MFLQGDPEETLVRVEATGGPGALLAGGGCGQRVFFSMTADAVIGSRHLCFYAPFLQPCLHPWMRALLLELATIPRGYAAPGHSLLLSREAAGSVRSV